MESFQLPLRSMAAFGIACLIFSRIEAAELTPYICPGIKIGWDSNRGFVMGPKISIGVANLDRVSYVNLTLGARAFKGSKQTPRGFMYLDV